MSSSATPKPTIRVVFQGVSGAYSEAAARELLNITPSSRFLPIGLPTFDACFKAVANGEAEYACLPMENTMGGSISDNFDLQLKNSLHSTAEIHFPVRHCLLALPGQTKKDIKIVMSHPQALAQCAEYLHRELPWAKIKPESDTAGSAQLISGQNMMGCACLASKTAADAYGLTVVEEGVQDAKDNFTRFLLYARAPVDATRAVQEGFKVKGSIVFTVGSRAGALHHAIEPFARYKLNMTKLESRPDRRQDNSMKIRDGGALNLLFGENFLKDLPNQEDPSILDDTGGELEFKAMFFLDFVISSGTREAIRELAAMSPFFRVLGVYPADGLLIGHVAEAVGCAEGTNFTRGKQFRPPIVVEPSAKRMKSTTEAFTIAVIGFGNFGQFLSKQFRSFGYRVVTSSRSYKNYKPFAEEHEIDLFQDHNILFESVPNVDVIVISTSIFSFEDLMKNLSPKQVEDKLIVDVLSVKSHAKNVLLDAFGKTERVDILCTHPMFGPESGKFSWRGLPFVYEKVRIKNENRCAQFLNIFDKSGCKMIQLSCEEHDTKAANSQFLTHFTGRVLNELHLTRTGIDTKGFLSLLDLVENTCRDSDDLFLALFRHNPNAAATLDAVRLAVDGVAFRLKSFARNNSDNILLSDAVNRIAPSKTVKVHGLAMDLARSGKDVITTLTVGEPNFGPPEEAIQAAEACLRDPKGTKYTAVTGTIELRKAITQDYTDRKGVTYDPVKEVLVSSGGKQSIFQVVNALCGPSDEVIIPSPFWVSYPDICRLAGAKPVIVRREPQNNYILTPEQLESHITERTRLFILCNPCNPTGCLYTESDLRALAKVLEKFPKVYILSDEIYERIIYDNQKHISFAKFLKNRTIVVNGIAKGFAMTGLRIGWACGPQEIIRACEKLQSQINSSASSVSQAAACRALQLGPETVAGPGIQNLNMLLHNRNLGHLLLKEIPGVETIKGGGAFYFFVSLAPDYRPKGLTCEKLCEYLIRREKGVAFVPGDAFGETPESCSFRISYACHESDLKEGILRFKDGLRELSESSSNH